MDMPEPEKEIISCCVCQKQFSALYNLNKHARKFHAEQVNLIILKSNETSNKTYQCTDCPKLFSILNNFNYHKKTHHNQHNTLSSGSKQYAECSICKLRAPKRILIPHFEVEHDIKFVTQSFEFTSFEEFSTWKAGMEHDTKSKYVVERGSQGTKGGNRIIKYCCHRSGKYNNRGKGIRRLKTQGSNKIGGFCPAHIKVIMNKNKQCKVFFTNQHVGHDEDDLGHLFLTPEERKSLANKVALKIPFTQILDDVRDSIVDGSELERIHLLNRKDLHNIQTSVHLQSTVVSHDDDAASVDAWVEQEGGSGDILFYKQDEQDLVTSENFNISEVCGIVTGLTPNESASTGGIDVTQLDTEKQKVIDSVTQLMERVTSMEQIDVVKKLVIALGPTLEAMVTKEQHPSVLQVGKILPLNESQHHQENKHIKTASS